MNERLLKTDEAAEQLGLKPNTLEGWRVRGCGPVFLKIGRFCFYEQSAIEDFKKQCRRQSTSQVA